MFITDCGKVQRKTRIINGQQTEVNEYPWMAGLGSKGSLSPRFGFGFVVYCFLLTTQLRRCLGVGPVRADRGPLLSGVSGSAVRLSKPERMQEDG